VGFFNDFFIRCLLLSLTVQKSRSATGSCNGVGCSTDVGSISWKKTWSSPHNSDLCNGSSCCWCRLPAQQTSETERPWSPVRQTPKKYGLARRWFRRDGSWAECDRSTNKLCGRPPQYAPTPCKLTFDLLTLKVVSESRVTWATSMPILVFLGLSVLDLGPMHATDMQTSDAHYRLMPIPARVQIRGPRSLFRIKRRNNTHDVTHFT